jgi:plastocyanin
MTRLLSLPLISLAISGLVGCTPGEIGPGSGPGGGGGGGDDGPDAGVSQNAPDAEPAAPDAAPPDYAMSVGPTAGVDLALGQVAELEVTLTSERYDGPVSLAVAGAPASWNITYPEGDTVDLAYDGTATATIQIELPSNGEALSSVLQVTANAGPGERIGTVPVTAINELTVVISDGTADGQHNFPSAAEIRLGAAVKILNADGTLHRIHSDNGNAGFPHQDGEMSQGESYSFTIDQTGQFNYYCHEHNVGAGVGSFVVVNP